MSRLKTPQTDCMVSIETRKGGNFFKKISAFPQPEAAWHTEKIQHALFWPANVHEFPKQCYITPQPWRDKSDHQQRSSQHRSNQHELMKQNQKTEQPITLKLTNTNQITERLSNVTLYPTTVPKIFEKIVQNDQ